MAISFSRWRCLMVLLTAMAAIAAAGCTDCEERGGAEISIPPLPFDGTDVIDFDEPRIAEQASGYCDEVCEGASSERFFLGRLPAAAMEMLCESGPDDPIVPYLFGDLVLSGYFGGVWLRDSMEKAPVSRAEAFAAEKNFMIETLSKVAAGRIDLVANGSDNEILSSARNALPFLLFIYGYNFGYVEVALENPPEGLAPSENLLVCEGFLDCESPVVHLGGLERFREALDMLAAPPDWRWQWMSTMVPRWGESSVESGRDVWESILEHSTFSDATYGTLLDLSIGFLLLTDVTVLSGMTAWADENVEAGRCAALLQAGLTVWAGSYFMGLTSSEEPGTFPTLTCR